MLNSLLNTKNLKITIGVLVILNILLLAGLGGLFYVVEETGRSIIALSKSLNIVVLEEQQQKVLALLLEETASEREKLSAYFIHTEQVVSFLKTIEGLGKSSGVSIAIASVNPTIENEKEMLTIEIDASGTFSELIHLLALLEHMPLSIVMERFFLSRKVSTTLSSTEKAKTKAVDWEGSFVLSVLSFSK